MPIPIESQNQKTFMNILTGRAMQVRPGYLTNLDTPKHTDTLPEQLMRNNYRLLR